LCPLPLGPCRESSFSISFYEDKQSKPIGQIYKQFAGVSEGCFSSGAQYVVEFPKNMDWKSKLLIITGVQQIDMHFFEGCGN